MRDFYRLLLLFEGPARATLLARRFIESRRARAYQATRTHASINNYTRRKWNTSAITGPSN